MTQASIDTSCPVFLCGAFWCRLIQCTIIPCMLMTVVQFRAFTAKWASQKLNDDDLQAPELQLMRNPLAGPVMAGTGGVRKARFAPPSRHAGKSGSFRVCYLWFPQHAIIALMTIFAKNEQGNLDRAQRNTLAGLVKQYSDELNKGARL